MRRDSQLKSRGENDNYDTALDGSTQSLNSSATEATSRLFERGNEIHEVQQFTLHSSWQQLLATRTCGQTLVPFGDRMFAAPISTLWR